MSIYDIQVKTINGQEKSMADYKGKVLIIVNTASKCGLTPQFKQLQELYDQYHEKGLEILGFPCNQFMNQEPEGEEAIQEFCSLNYGVTFPMFAKVDVNGEEAHPLFKHLTSEAKGVLGTKTVKWNFTKFIVDQNGEVTERFSPKTPPKELESSIIALLNK
ncbi:MULTISPECIES: glutathione peroxidase [Bacillus]|uniref:Glutathione peroxidase n=2 Tax=Bacillus safensis TaxID=561879 RepID=A0A5C0WKC4_BACIA|nr:MULTISPECIES: glutathione peroxidase [Bacillus]AYJ89331.1 glutathione peroxidase [Bacillus safensis]MBG9825224.1 glutathione peroxidase [Bacillus safensis]MBG9834870.1 glutathione peroxidase [Bacillus safensis]MBG9860999.1 glutathione peroxidase [Bacillus safensis]MBG9899813.1 glutathione peroxidase [Bacillus safensis]